MFDFKTSLVLSSFIWHELTGLFRTRLDLSSICLIHFTMMWNWYIVKYWQDLKTSLDMSSFSWCKSSFFRTSLDLSSSDQHELTELFMTGQDSFSICLKHFTMLWNRYVVFKNWHVCLRQDETCLVLYNKDWQDCFRQV